MGINDINSSTETNLTNQQTNYSVDTQQTDGPSDQKETTWENDKWTQYFGYYKEIPELSSVIDAKATWTVGKGFSTDPDTEAILLGIKGWGKDTFNTILENLIRTYNIGGDAFAEIIRSKEGEFINLKPIDPGSMIIIVDRKGLVKRYEQKTKVEKPNKRFKKEDIFHLARNRVADEIHGQSIIEKLEWIILAKNEAMSDMKTLMHRHVKPMRVWKVNTDNTTKIAAFKSMVERATENAENLVLPQETVEHEVVAVPANATLSPLAWIESLDSKFYEAAQVPKIIVGGTGAITEAAVKIAYLAWQQTVEEEQLFIEESVGNQLGIAIDLEFPASIENELISDKKKDGAQNIDKSETTAGAGQ